VSGATTPERVAAITVDGQEWTVSWGEEGPQEAEHFQFGTLAACPAICWIEQVKLGDKWLQVCEVFSEAYAERMNDTLAALQDHRESQ